MVVGGGLVHCYVYSICGRYVGVTDVFRLVVDFRLVDLSDWLVDLPGYLDGLVILFNLICVWLLLFYLALNGLFVKTA